MGDGQTQPRGHRYLTVCNFQGGRGGGLPGPQLIGEGTTALPLLRGKLVDKAADVKKFSIFFARKWAKTATVSLKIYQSILIRIE